MQLKHRELWLMTIIGFLLALVIIVVYYVFIDSGVRPWP